MRNLLFGTAFAAALAVGAAAQTPQTPPTSTTPTAQEPMSSPSRQASSDKNQTFTGCLQAADSPSGATGTAGSAAGASSRADNFILANASSGAGSSMGTSPSPTAGTSGAGAAAGAATSYRLMGGSKDDLRKYVNSKVEITGRLDNAGGASATAPSASAGQAGSSARGPQLHVESVKQISPSCN